eukprot:CFRG3604T1
MMARMASSPSQKSEHKTQGAQPTEVQMRLQGLTASSKYSEDDIKAMVGQVKELSPGMKDDIILKYLHENEYDVQNTVLCILDGETAPVEESWTETKKKSKKPKGTGPPTNKSRYPRDSSSQHQQRGTTGGDRGSRSTYPRGGHSGQQGRHQNLIQNTQQNRKSGISEGIDHPAPPNTTAESTTNQWDAAPSWGMQKKWITENTTEESTDFGSSMAEVEDVTSGVAKTSIQSQWGVNNNAASTNANGIQSQQTSTTAAAATISQNNEKNSNHRNNNRQNQSQQTTSSTSEKKAGARVAWASLFTPAPTPVPVPTSAPVSKTSRVTPTPNTVSSYNTTANTAAPVPTQATQHATPVPTEADIETSESLEAEKAVTATAELALKEDSPTPTSTSSINSANITSTPTSQPSKQEYQQEDTTPAPTTTTSQVIGSQKPVEQQQQQQRRQKPVPTEPVTMPTSVASVAGGLDLQFGSLGGFNIDNMIDNAGSSPVATSSYNNNTSPVVAASQPEKATGSVPMAIGNAVSAAPSVPASSSAPVNTTPKDIESPTSQQKQMQPSAQQGTAQDKPQATPQQPQQQYTQNSQHQAAVAQNNGSGRRGRGGNSSNNGHHQYNQHMMQAQGVPPHLHAQAVQAGGAYQQSHMEAYGTVDPSSIAPMGYGYAHPGTMATGFGMPGWGFSYEQDVRSGAGMGGMGYYDPNANAYAPPPQTRGVGSGRDHAVRHSNSAEKYNNGVSASNMDGGLSQGNPAHSGGSAAVPPQPQHFGMYGNPYAPHNAYGQYYMGTPNPYQQAYPVQPKYNMGYQMYNQHQQQPAAQQQQQTKQQQQQNTQQPQVAYGNVQYGQQHAGAAGTVGLPQTTTVNAGSNTGSTMNKQASGSTANPNTAQTAGGISSVSASGNPYQQYETQQTRASSAGQQGNSTSPNGTVASVSNTNNVAGSVGSYGSMNGRGSAGKSSSGSIDPYKSQSFDEKPAAQVQQPYDPSANGPYYGNANRMSASVVSSAPKQNSNPYGQQSYLSQQQVYEQQQQQQRAGYWPQQ